MKHRLIIMTISVLASATAWGAPQICANHYQGTTMYPPTSAFPPGVKSVHCADCREVIGFTQDSINYLWNRATHGIGGYQPDSDPVANQFYFMTHQTYSPSIYMTTSVCNDHGQCISVTLTVNFNYIDLDPLPFTRNTSIKNVKARATRRDGTQLNRNYDPEQIEADPFSVPSNNTKDPHPKTECLDNLGELVLPPAHVPIEDDIPSGDRPFQYDDYQHWHDQEEAWGGRVPHLECGIASVPGGTSTRTCTWLYF